jgi:branched-chain amino acid transport system permease protein/neutral amino acid transport system permease protein
VTAIEQEAATFQFRDWQRRFGNFATGAGLWIVIIAFVVWAAAAERDALVVGIIFGAILALGAVGLTLIYGVLKFGHFAHGDSMMFSAYLAFLFLTGLITGERASDDTTLLPINTADLPGATDKIWKFSFGYDLLVAMLLASIASAGLLVLLDRFVYRRLRERKSGVIIFSIAALGIAIALRSVILIFWGPDNRFYQPGIRNRVDLLFDVSVRADQIFIFCAALAVTAAVYYLLFRTKLGKAMRAMADNPDLARVSGIDNDRIITWTWIVSGFLVSIAGVLLALESKLDPEQGFVLLLPLFAAAILGGLGNPLGALVGGFVVGIMQEVSVTFDISFIRDGFPGPGYKFSVAFIILIVILLVRPRGLFGERT